MPLDTPTLLDPAYKALCSRIADEIDSRVYSLASGSAFLSIDDTKTVAEKYAMDVAHIQALQSVFALCKELERKRFGNSPGNREED